MNVSGTVKDLLSPIQVTEKLKKANVIVQTSDNPQYPQVISFELVNDKCDLLNKLSLGQSVDVHFNLNGREWVNKQGVKQYFNTLQAWKIDVLSEEELAF